MVINLSDEDKDLPLWIDNFTPDGETEVWRFDAEHDAELLGIEPLPQTITLPGQSINLYVIPGSPVSGTT